MLFRKTGKEQRHFQRIPKGITMLLLSFGLAGALLIYSGCAKKTVDQPQPGPVAFQIVDPSSEFFQQLPGELVKWYEENYRSSGLYTRTVDGDTYILLSAGEKPTGGYAVEEFKLNGTAGEINVTASLRVPGAEDIVTQALTYPHILVQVKEDQRQIRLDSFVDKSLESEDPGENKQDSGTYTGQIDGNSIEIKISGVPDQLAARAFRLGEQVKKEFESYQLKTGDQVLFTYYANENGQQVITDIKKIQISGSE
ncbi:MAG: protease complex subunit PrcB family protein [Bacillota bacterium]